MTLAVNIMGKDCLVMAIDSWKTYNVQCKNGEKIIIHKDDAEKIHVLHSKFVVSFVGWLGESSYNHVLEDILYEYVDINESILGVANSRYSETLIFQDTIDYFKDRFPAIYKDIERTEIFIGGYNNTCVLQYLEFINGIFKVTSSTYLFNPGNILIQGSSVDEAVIFLKKEFGGKDGITLNEIAEKYLENLNEADCIKLCVSIINNVIDFCKVLEKDKQDVGGNVKITVIDKDGVRK